MKSKAPLALMEQLLMILFFALATSVAIRVFVYADQLSMEKAHRDEALIQGRTVAEVYKNARGDMDTMLARYGGTYAGRVWTTYWTDAWEPCEQGEESYALVVEEVQDADPYLRMSRISAVHGDGTLLYTFPVAWQEDAS